MENNYLQLLEYEELIENSIRERDLLEDQYEEKMKEIESLYRFYSLFEKNIREFKRKLKKSQEERNVIKKEILGKMNFIELLRNKIIEVLEEKLKMSRK